MPIYEYRRKDGTTFEVIQKFSDEALTTDPETGEPVERVYSAPAIHFKGSGFHNTDYSSGRRPRAGGSDTSSGDSASSSGEGGEKSGSSGGDSKATESGSSGTSGPTESKSGPKSTTGSSAD